MPRRKRSGGGVAESASAAQTPEAEAAGPAVGEALGAVDTAGYPHNRNLADALRRCLDGAITPRARRGARTIVMLSGGLDSIALLANVLTETDHAVHAHHIEIVNYEERWRVESEALEKALAYFRRNYRPFDYTTSRNEFSVGKGGGTDLQLCLFTAFRLSTALGGGFDFVMTGHITPPFWELSEGAAVFNAGFIHKKSKPEWVWPLRYLASSHHRKKLDIYESIPEDLADMAWSCRKPVLAKKIYRPCGTCFACKSMQAVRRMRDERAAAGPPPAGARARRHAGRGGWKAGARA